MKLHRGAGVGMNKTQASGLPFCQLRVAQRRIREEVSEKKKKEEEMKIIRSCACVRSEWLACRIEIRAGGKKQDKMKKKYRPSLK